MTRQGGCRAAVGGDAGFTLLELIVALAIAALVFALVIPSSLHRNAHVTLQRTSRDLAEALRLTRSRAVLDNRSTRFMVDTDRATWRIDGGAALQSLPSGMRVVLVTAAEETEGKSLGAIRFYPDGSSTGGSLTLSLGKDQMDVAVDWLTGNVAVHDVAAR
jgi:general secretion pathway protein H